jgi:hypothetical protein
MGVQMRLTDGGRTAERSPGRRVLLQRKIGYGL